MAHSRHLKVQSTEVTYELHTLGWKQFQNLCSTIMGEIWGQTIQTFFDSHDGGRDGAFHGVWRPKDGEVFEGTFTVQCKFTAKANQSIRLSDLEDELNKAKRLAACGLSTNYFLLTNARLTGIAEEKIRQAFSKIPRIKNFVAYGSDRISQIIRESSRLRMLVPRVYGLGDLSLILDERALSQAREILSALGDDLQKFVITEAYQRSAKALIEHGFVLLLGEPACGKSTIAAALAVSALDEWGCSTFKICTADDFLAHWNPDEPKQFFWVDDAFGATQHDWSSTVAWNGIFAHMQSAIRRGARVLFTSRDYIYKAARHHLKESALPVLREGQVVIRVEELSEEERGQILYNHIRLGSQQQKFKSQIKPLLSDVAKHPQFSPEIARRLGDPLFTKKLPVCRDALMHFVAHPVELLCEILRTIDSGSRSALALIFMHGGSLPSPMDISDDEKYAISLMGGSMENIRNALNALNGSLVISSIQDGHYSWRFKHPTVRDAFAATIAEDRELMDIYLAGMPLDGLFREVTCGDVGVQGVGIVVPSDRYDLILKRLRATTFKSHTAVRSLHHFLAFRCDRDFIESYINENSEFIEELRVGSYMDWSYELDVVIMLHEFSLLPETKRMSIVAAIRKLATETPDSGFLSERVRQLFTPEEFSLILDDVRTKLIPDISETISDWRLNYNSDDGENPESYFSGLVSTLNEYKEEFIQHPDICGKIEMALAEIESVIDELDATKPEPPDDCDFDGNVPKSSKNFIRSVFDDVDQ